MSTSESRRKREPVSSEARSVQDRPRISPLFMIAGPIVGTAAVAGVVVLAALISWWVLFALFALPPLLMMFYGPMMMTAMGDPTGSGPSTAGWCPRWQRPAPWAG